MAGVSALAISACHDPTRYSDADAARLDAQRRDELLRSGAGPYGRQVFHGYRGLAELPWYELDAKGRLRCTVENLPAAIDIHAHLGIALLLAPELDLQAQTPRVKHILDCDRADPGCELDLDVYINANFTAADLSALNKGALAQLTWGSEDTATHTIPNLIDEMDSCVVGQAAILPICFGLPFGDHQTHTWRDAIEKSSHADRFITGASVHPRDSDAVAQLREHAERGARIVKLHPAMQRFFPDSPELYPIYEECGRLGLPIIFHGGRAGIEPAYAHQFTLMRHYEGAFRDFPKTQFILGHAGARDVADAIPLAKKYPDNVWLGIHGQGVSSLQQLVDEVGGDRLLFGTDWPFYHLAATQAKVLMISEGDSGLRRAILRDNALRMFSQSQAVANASSTTKSGAKSAYERIS
jgi:hypothetical protein